jgi:hypothetical protein
MTAGPVPDWQQAICRQVRDLVHAAGPEVSETTKRTRQPYFVLQGNICALPAARHHVNVFLYDGGRFCGLLSGQVFAVQRETLDL